MLKSNEKNKFIGYFQLIISILWNIPKNQQKVGFIHKNINMNFWERVDQLLDEKGITKKSLSTEAGFDPSNISKGLKKNNMPSAETAVRIAEILEVSVEYLVTGQNQYKNNSLELGENNPEYKSALQDLSSLPKDKQDVVFNLIKNLKTL